jgi:hypothetical protein
MRRPDFIRFLGGATAWVAAARATALSILGEVIPRPYYRHGIGTVSQIDAPAHYKQTNKCKRHVSPFML